MAFTVYEKLENIKNDAEINLASLISSSGLDAVSSYIIGPPTDASLNQVGVYPDEQRPSESFEEFVFFMQLQLSSVDPETSYKYQQTLYEYLKTFDPALIGLNQGQK